MIKDLQIKLDKEFASKFIPLEAIYDEEVGQYRYPSSKILAHIHERDQAILDWVCMEIEKTISKKADEYNTEWGVNTCAALIATKIEIINLIKEIR